MSGSSRVRNKHKQEPRECPRGEGRSGTGGAGKGKERGGEPAEVLVEDKNTKEPREERREKKRKKENAARAELFAVEAWRRHAARVELSPLRL